MVPCNNIHPFSHKYSLFFASHFFSINLASFNIFLLPIMITTTCNVIWHVVVKYQLICELQRAAQPVVTFGHECPPTCMSDYLISNQNNSRISILLGNLGITKEMPPSPETTGNLKRKKTH